MQLGFAAVAVARVAAALKEFEVCNDNWALQWQQEAAARTACRTLGHWPTVALNLAPEAFLRVRASGQRWAAGWSYPNLGITAWSSVFRQMTTVAYWVESAVATDPLQGADDPLLCQVLGKCMALFLAAVHLSSLEPSHVAGVLEDMDNLELTSGGVELLRPAAAGPLAADIFKLLRDRGSWLSAPAAGLFGLLQWLAMLRHYVPGLGWLGGYMALSGPPVGGCNASSASLEILVDLLHRYCMPNTSAPALGPLLDCGTEAWGPLAVASAARHEVAPTLLVPPRLGGLRRPVPGVGPEPGVELCTAAAWRAGWAPSPVLSTPQRDGSVVHVVAAALHREARSADSQATSMALEFLVFTEKPLQALTCGPHMSHLQETPFMNWSCEFESRSNYRHVVKAAVASLYRQSTILSCPVPSRSLDGAAATVGEFPAAVMLRAPSPARANATWEVQVDVCRKHGIPRSNSGNRVPRAAICVQPVWDLPGFEKAAPRLIELYLHYHKLIGFQAFSIYDYDGTFQAHPVLRRLAADGSLRYYPRWPRMISRTTEAASRSLGGRGSMTGTKSMFVAELTLTHCLWGYRGDFDFVLLGALDAFLSLGPTTPLETCWPGEPLRFRECCHGGRGPRGGFPQDRQCSSGGKTFAGCCLHYAPKASPVRPSLAGFLGTLPRAAREGLGTVLLPVCDFVALKAPKRNASFDFFAHLWRTPSCSNMYYHLVSPEHVLTQNFEWVRLRRQAGIYAPGPGDVRVLHFVNIYRARCTRLSNHYGQARQPCNEPDHSLRWAFPYLRSDNGV